MQGRKKRIFYVGIGMAVALLVAGGSMLYAHLGGSGGWDSLSPEERAARFSDFLTRKLALNETQQQELRAVVTELGGKRKEMMDFHAKARDELLGILRNEDVNRGRVEQQVTTHKEKINELTAVVSDRLTGFAGTLSKEQRGRVAQIVEEHTALHGLHGPHEGSGTLP